LCCLVLVCARAVGRNYTIQWATAEALLRLGDDETRRGAEAPALLAGRRRGDVTVGPDDAAVSRDAHRIREHDAWRVDAPIGPRLAAIRIRNRKPARPITELSAS
jgi:hypothetical protein